MTAVTVAVAVVLAPAALLLILTTNGALAHECRVWARSVAPLPTTHT